MVERYYFKLYTNFPFVTFDVICQKERSSGHSTQVFAFMCFFLSFIHSVSQ